MKSYVEKLTNHLKPFSKIEIDLIISGGAFNGSYLEGSLGYLRCLCKKNRIKINRISGCSIGSLLAYLFIIDKIHLSKKIYRIAYSCFTKHGTIHHLYKIIELLKKHQPINVLKLVNNKLFISYHNVKTRKHVVKSNYKSEDEIYDAILKSSHLSFIVNGDIFYKNVYFDGILPYNFKKRKNTMRLYLDILTLDKICNAINVVNEKSNSHRELCGIIDTHMFFVKKTSTNMCSFIENWTYSDYLNNYFKCYLRCIIFYLFIVIYNIHLSLKNKIIQSIKSTLFYKLYLLNLKEIIKHYNT